MEKTSRLYYTSKTKRLAALNDADDHKDNYKEIFHEIKEFTVEKKT